MPVSSLVHRRLVLSVAAAASGAALLPGRVRAQQRFAGRELVMQVSAGRART